MGPEKLGCLCTINAIHPDIRPPIQQSTVDALLDVKHGDMPVLGEAHIPVQCALPGCWRSQWWSFPIGHPFLTQAQACPDFGNHRIVLFDEDVPYFHAQSKLKTHAVRVARTAVLESVQEYMVRKNIHFREPVEGEVVQHLKDWALATMDLDTCLIYLDDIIVLLKTMSFNPVLNCFSG